MMICPTHWQQMRDAVEERGMTHLVARNGKEAVDNLVAEAEGHKPAFDPLMAMNNNFWSAALEHGGLGVMGVPEDDHPLIAATTTDAKGMRHFCPLCLARELGAQPETDQQWIRGCADAMLKHARGEGLMPALQL